MTHSSSSEPGFTAEDYLLYLKCPRSAHLALTGEWLPASQTLPGEEMSSGQVYPWGDGELPVPADRAEVLEAAALHLRFPGPAEFAYSISAPPMVAVADIWHPQKPEGMAAALIREATGLKKSYLVESAFIRYCAERAGEPLSRQFVYYLNRRYIHGEETDVPLFVSSDVTRRAKSVLDEHRKRLDALSAELASDPYLEYYRHRECAHPRTCPVCGRDQPPVGVDHITSLYRGGELMRTLQSEGYESISDVPESRLTHPRQRIQRDALRSGRPHIDRERLIEFLSSLRFPVHYLDFEAVSVPVPAYPGTRPWEHVPYLFSVHTERSAGNTSAAGAPAVEIGELEHTAFLMDPEEDQRRELLARLLDALGDSGSVVVYGAAFESGVLSRLAGVYPEFRPRVDAVVKRIADLLLPFKEFAFYDRRQRGKASLKTVLPVLSDTDYADLPVRDGYTANIAYRYMERFAPEESERESLKAHLVSYCTMDTLAMVHIVRRLRLLLE